MSFVGFFLLRSFGLVRLAAVGFAALEGVEFVFGVWEGIGCFRQGVEVVEVDVYAEIGGCLSFFADGADVVELMFVCFSFGLDFGADASS